jgi:hypothetical protein
MGVEEPYRERYLAEEAQQAADQAQHGEDE